MSDQGNIFLTWENLAFSLPLLTVVGAYLFFLYVPLWAAAGLFAFLYVLWQIRKQLRTLREKKLLKLDEKAIQEILGEADEETDARKQAELTKAKKAKNKLHQRLAEQRKAENRKLSETSGGAAVGKKKKKDAQEEEDVDEADLIKFAKGSRTAKSKNQ